MVWRCFPMPAEFAVFSWWHRNFFLSFVFCRFCFVCLVLNFKVKEKLCISCRLNFGLVWPEIAISYLFSDMEMYFSSLFCKNRGWQNTLPRGFETKTPQEVQSTKFAHKIVSNENIFRVNTAVDQSHFLQVQKSTNNAIQHLGKMHRLGAGFHISPQLKKLPEISPIFKGSDDVVGHTFSIKTEENWKVGMIRYTQSAQVVGFVNQSPSCFELRIFCQQMIFHHVQHFDDNLHAHMGDRFSFHSEIVLTNRF